MTWTHSSEHCYYEFVDADLYVSPDGDDSYSGLIPQFPLKTIAHAITISVSDQDDPNVIHLLPGYYSRSANDQLFPLNMRECVSLQGTSRDEVFLDREGRSGYINDFYSGYNYSINNITFTGGETLSNHDDEIVLKDYTGESDGTVRMDSLRFTDSQAEFSIFSTTVEFELSNIIVEDTQSCLLKYSAFPGEHSMIRNTIYRNAPTLDFWFMCNVPTYNPPILDLVNYLSCNNNPQEESRIPGYGPCIDYYAHANFVNCTFMNNSDDEFYTSYINGWFGSTGIIEKNQNEMPENKRVFAYTKNHESWNCSFCLVSTDGEEHHVQQILIKDYKCSIGNVIYEG